MWVRIVSRSRRGGETHAARKGGQPRGRIAAPAARDGALKRASSCVRYGIDDLPVLINVFVENLVEIIVFRDVWMVRRNPGPSSVPHPAAHASFARCVVFSRCAGLL